MSILFRHATENFYAHHKRELHPRQDDFPLHVHDAHEFCYFISGSGRFYIESGSYDLYPGCILIIRAGEAHRLKINSEMPYERIDIEFSPALFTDVDSQGLLTKAFTDRPAGQGNLYTPDRLNTELVRSCMNMLSAQFRVIPNPQKPLTMISCLAPVLLDIRRAFLAQENMDSTQSGKVVTVVSQVVEYINAHLCEKISLDSLAKKFFISKTHLNNQFKQATSFTVWEYIVIKRLVLARQHIRDGMSVGMAAIACGWNDYSSFYRSYKARFGISPSDEKRADAITLNPEYDIRHSMGK